MLQHLWCARRRQLPLISVDLDIARDAGEERRGVCKLTARLALNGDPTEAQRAELPAVAKKCSIQRLMTAADVQIRTKSA